MPGLNGRRVAVIAGVRTPFTKAGTSLKDARAVDLARYAARELLERTNLDGTEVDEVIFGQVVPSALVPNVGREVSLLPQLPKEIPAYSLNRACASANQAITAAQDQIARHPDDVEAHTLLGKVYLRSLGDMQNAQSGQMLQLAIAEYQKLAQLKPNDIEIHLLLGQLYSFNHDSAKAESEFKAAQKSCEKLLPNGGKPDAASVAKERAQMLKFSACMRSHGLADFPDPTVSEGGLQLSLGDKRNSSLNPNSPVFQAAQKACQSSMPGPPGDVGMKVGSTLRNGSSSGGR